MKKNNFLNSQCRHCRFYQPEGRRGGCCQKLGVEVEASWSICNLASFPFSDSLDQLDSALSIIDKTLSSLEEVFILETAFSLPCEMKERPEDLAKQVTALPPLKGNR